MIENRLANTHAFALPFSPAVRPHQVKLTFKMTASAAPLSSPTLRTALKTLLTSLPALDEYTHKGQSGRICIVGGSPEYTGAPYFAAMSCLRAGADLAYVVTQEQTAAIAIKASAPDVVVYPSFDCIRCQPSSVLSRAHAVIIGPGLGRSTQAADIIMTILKHEDMQSIPLVMDADALFFIASDTTREIREFLCDKQNSQRTAPIILTPNAMELRRMYSAMDVSNTQSLMSLFRPSVVVLQKGSCDHIYSHQHCISVSVSASMKRVGGQGDFLAGFVAICVAWMHIVIKRNIALSSSNSSQNPDRLNVEQALVAAAAAAALTRETSRRAFNSYGRAMIASDMLSVIKSVMQDFEFGSLIDDLAPEM